MIDTSKWKRRILILFLCICAGVFAAYRKPGMSKNDSAISDAGQLAGTPADLPLRVVAKVTLPRDVDRSEDPPEQIPASAPPVLDFPLPSLRDDTRTALIAERHLTTGEAVPPTLHAISSLRATESTLEASNLVEAASESPQTSGEIEHRVAFGDTLPKLANRYLGDSKRWIDIYLANRRSLVRPDILPIGSRLQIPPM